MATKHLHSRSTIGAIHIPYDNTYSNETARLAAGGFSVNDIGKFYRQLDDDSIWMLKQYSPCNIWRRVSGDDVSYATKTLYCNSIIGDDSIADGSSNYPFATPTAMWASIPEKLKHIYNLKYTGSFSDYPHVAGRAYEDRGMIVEEGLGTWTHVAGTFTVNSITNLGTQWSGHVINVSGAAWTPDAYQSYFVLVKTGAAAGRLFGIFKNDSDNIITHYCYYQMSPGDTFDIVIPPVTITVDHPVTWCQDDSTSGVKEQAYWWSRARHAIAAINFVCTDVTGTYSPESPFQFTSKSSYSYFFPNFCRFQMQGAGQGVMVRGASVGAFVGMLIEDGTFTNNLYKDSYHVSNVIAGNAGVTPSGDNAWLVTINAGSVSNFVLRGMCVSDARNGSSGSWFNYIACTGFRILQSTGSILYYNYVDANDPTSTEGIEQEEGFVYINGVYIQRASHGVNMTSSGRMESFYLEGVGGNIPGYALTMGLQSKFICKTAHSLAGVSGQIRFVQTASTDSWPGAGLSVTDSQGCRVSRVP